MVYAISRPLIWTGKCKGGLRQRQGNQLEDPTSTPIDSTSDQSASRVFDTGPPAVGSAEFVIVHLRRQFPAFLCSSRIRADKDPGWAEPDASTWCPAPQHGMGLRHRRQRRTRDQTYAQRNVRGQMRRADASDAPVKRTAVERQVNRQILYLFILLLILSLVSTIGSSVRKVCTQ